jgi:AraC family transcriptional activator of pobA
MMIKANAAVLVPAPENYKLDSTPFNAQIFEGTGKYATVPYNRRDYYKIWSIKGPAKLHFADRSVDINRSALIFSNPLVPYSLESFSNDRSGYMCVFTDEFLKTKERLDSIQESPLFKVGSDQVFFPDETQLSFIHVLYSKMVAELNSNYVYKYDVIRNYVNLMIHEGMKMQPAMSDIQYNNAASRIASLFLELLERQFPIDSPHFVLKLRKANDYAESLSIHVNHLNNAVREITGKTTTTHITERIVSEAKALLRHTNWSIADIAYCLGFEYSSYFNNFFKKNTGVTPLSLRK